MLFRDSVLLERIFNVFDTNHDQGINFVEFISCLSTLSTKASPEEKIRCIDHHSPPSISLLLLIPSLSLSLLTLPALPLSMTVSASLFILSLLARPPLPPPVSFSIYDYDSDGFISKEELSHMLAATMREHEIVLTASDVEGIIQSTFAEVRPSHPEKISFDE
jgi:hypothetical protein